MSAYILVACVECYRRYPEIIDEITRAATPEDLGREGHRLATQIDPVHMWAVPNFFLIGRKVLAAAGLVDAAEDEQRLATVFDFWSRASGAYRFGDGTHQASDADGVATPYRALVDEIARQCKPVTDAEQRASISRLNALLTSYLFLLWFDTRSGYQDTGPYALPDGRALLLRAYNRLGVSHFPWSAEVSAEMPQQELLGASRRSASSTSRRVRLSPSTPRSATRSRPRRSPRSGSCTGRSRPWNAGPRSTRARTCTSPSCARSRSSPA